MRAYRSIIHRTCKTSLLLGSLFAQACSTETTPTDPLEPQPTIGSLELTIEETGPRPDTDGYEVSITLATQTGPVVRSVPQGGGSLLLADIPLGVHVLRVEGLAAHCWVTGNHPRAFTVEAGKTTQVVVGISCPGPGAVLVKTVTRGRDVGTAAYTVSIQGETAQESSIGTNDSLQIGEEHLPAGTKWFVQLSGVPDNCWVERPAQEVRQLRGATVRVEYAVVCIPRSSRIAFEYLGGIELTSGAETVRLAGSLGAPDGGPSLSPDRSRVVFSSNPETIDFVLAVVKADGSGFMWLTSYDGGSSVGSQAWSPDGSRIVFWKQRGASSDIYIMNADGTGEVRLTHSGWNTHPAWSPDGRSIAFCRIEGVDFENWPAIYRMSAIDGSGITKLAEPGCDPAWSPDGSKIAFTHQLSIWPDLAVIGADGSGLTTLHSSVPTPGQSSRRPSWSPDGSQIAYSGGQSSHRIWIVGFDGNAFGEPFPFRFGSAPSWR